MKADIADVQLKFVILYWMLKFQRVEAVSCGNQRKPCGVINTFSGNPLEMKYKNIFLRKEI